MEYEYIKKKEKEVWKSFSIFKSKIVLRGEKTKQTWRQLLTFEAFRLLNRFRNMEQK